MTKQELLGKDYPNPSAAQYYVYELDFDKSISMNLDESLMDKLEKFNYKPQCLSLEDLLMGEV